MPPALFLGFKIALAIWCLFVFLFGLLVLSFEKYHWNFDRDCTDSVDCLG